MQSKSILSFNIILCGVILVLAISVVLLYLGQPKIAYVRSIELVENYKGTVEARAGFQKMKSSLMANVDSLKLNFENARSEYLTMAPRLTATQRAQQETSLGQQQSQLSQYSLAVDQKIKEEDAKMMQEVLNQINSFIEEYAQQKGFDVILGTTTSGSLLYGKESMDVTQPLLDELNVRYSGK